MADPFYILTKGARFSRKRTAPKPADQEVSTIISSYLTFLQAAEASQSAVSPSLGFFLPAGHVVPDPAPAKAKVL